MWPLSIDWQALRFGVEIEFVEGDPWAVELLPGWVMAPDEHQIDETGRESGSELKPPPLRWQEREQLREMLGRLRRTGAVANWSCGLHVHVGLEPWGQAIVPPLLEAALTFQGALGELFQTPEHRRIFCPPVTPAMLSQFAADPCRPSLVHRGRPQSHRCGINTAAWFDFGTVEIRYPNGSLDYDQVVATVEFCLRFVAAVGAGLKLPAEPQALAAALGAPAGGYPPPAPAPLWHQERTWLEESLIPVFGPLVLSQLPDGEILSIRPEPHGFLIVVEERGSRTSRLRFRPSATGWEMISLSEEVRLNFPSTRVRC